MTSTSGRLNRAAASAAPWERDGRSAVLERPRSVQVRHEDVWLDGYLTAQSRDPDGWYGLVTYRTGPGEQYRHWRPADQLRRGLALPLG